jgi:hypothetical protein
MQLNLFYHLVKKSTINRLKRDEDFCFTGTGIRTRRCDPVKGVPLPSMDFPKETRNGKPALMQEYPAPVK